MSAANARSATAQAVEQDAAILAASNVSPEAFVRALLKMYENGNVPIEQLPDNRTFFSAPTAALIARVSDANPEGVFSADPFCDCQDWNSLKVGAIGTTLSDATHANVHATCAAIRS